MPNRNEFDGHRASGYDTGEPTGESAVAPVAILLRSYALLAVFWIAVNPVAHGSESVTKGATWAADLNRELEAAHHDPATFAAALSRAADQFVMRVAEDPPNKREMDPLMVRIKEAAKDKRVPAIRHAAWRAAAASSHSLGLRVVQDSLKFVCSSASNEADANALADAVRDGRCAACHSLFLKFVERMWRAHDSDKARKSLRAALEKSALAVGAAPISDRKREKARAALVASFRKTLSSVREPAVRQEVLLALALAPNRPARGLLSEWFESRKAPRGEELVLVVSALGDAGDPGVIPFLRSMIMGSEPNVLAETVRSLHRCKPEALRVDPRAMFDALIRGLAEESKRLTALWDSKHKDRETLVARGNALYRSLPRKQGHHALLWKIIDANADLFMGLTPTPPSRGMIKQAKGGGGNVVTVVDWGEWWKVVRKKVRRRK